MGQAGGAARGGCAIFSFVGVLVTIGLTVWLGSQAMSSSTESGSGGASDGAVDETRAQAPSTTTPGQIAIEIRPADGLDEGASVTLTASRLDPGSAVAIDTCVASQAAVDIGPACSSAPTGASADAHGTFEAEFTPARLVPSGIGQIDCAASAGTCIVLAKGTVDGAPATGWVPLAFRRGLPNPGIEVNPDE